MSEHYKLSKEEVENIRNALEFFKGELLGNGGMSVLAAHHYNTAMDAVKKLENQDDEK
ncbi:hypothetical protein SM909_08785 [Klebsiella aerogenes]|uniref:hypothetical protein n=1 Tax=Klebsiella aerogenes TaxID=548 RepID=UPI002A821454|nr:hypothetical protein [Klebsiella aerogenes]WPR95444.1 hypothetical protein SM909_08785 [Klebsiella aerogenes]